jgi:hypothetical protein
MRSRRTPGVATREVAVTTGANGSECLVPLMPGFPAELGDFISASASISQSLKFYD